MCFRADGKKPESRDKLQSREMTGVIQVATCLRSQVGIGSR